METTVKRFGITEVFAPIEHPSADLILIHGLHGHPRSTWTSDISKIFWPAQLMPSVLQGKARILVYGYDADVTSFPSDRIHNHGEQLIAELVAYRRTSDTTQRPIVFVAHSIGGLILKSGLVYSSSIRGHHTEHLRSIFVSTYGILFLGTPHRGVDATKWVSRLEAISQMTSGKRPAGKLPYLIDVIDAKSETLSVMERSFVQLSHLFHLFLFHEGQPILDVSGGSDYLVDEYSASPTMPDVERAVIQQDHAHMCKFESSVAPGFDLVSEAIERYISASSGTIQSRWNLERAETQIKRKAEIDEISMKTRELITPDYKRPRIIDKRCHEHAASLAANVDAQSIVIDWAQLRKCLAPNEVMIEHTKHKRAYLSETATWLFTDENYTMWKSEAAPSSLLWINGNPGSGKSVLAFNVIRHLQAEVNSTVLFYYCSHDAKDELQHFTALKTLAYQLSLKSDDFAFSLIQELRHNGLFEAEKIEHYITCETFWTILSSSLENYSSTGPQYWIIDGLDELELRQRAFLLDCICELAARLPISRILIFSRDEPDIQRRLLGDSAIQLRINGDRNHSDIAKYISHRMRGWGGLGSVTLYDDVTSDLETRADGTFLWVKLVVDELERNHDQSQIKAILARLPNDIKDLYNNIIRDHLDRLGAEEKDLFQSIITWTALAQENLTLSQIAAGLSLRMNGIFSPPGLRRSMRRLCGSLVLAEDPDCDDASVQVRLLHASLAEYLTAESDPRCRYSLNIAEGHRLITSGCFAQLRAASQCPLFYPIGDVIIYKLSTFDLGRLVSSWKSVAGPDIIDTRCAEFNYSTSFISRPFIQQQFPLFDFAREHCFYHLDKCTSNHIIARVIAADLLDLIFRGPAMLILDGAARIKRHEEYLISNLSSFCRHCVSYDYFGFEIISDVVQQIVSSNTQGWLYGLGQMTGNVSRLLDQHEPMMKVENVDIEVSHQRKILKKGLAAYREGHPELALQAYIDSCDILLPKGMTFENMKNFYPEERLSAFEAIIGHICGTEEFWLIIIFGYAIKESGHDTWLKDFMHTLHSHVTSYPVLQELQAQLKFSWADYDAAAEIYMKIGATQTDRWDVREIAQSALLSNGRDMEATAILSAYQPGCDTHNAWCLAAWNKERVIQMHKKAGNHQRALTACREGLRDFPDWWEMWRLMFALCYESNAFTLVLGYLRQARRRHSFAFPASKELTTLLLKLRRYEEAFTEAKSIIEEHPRTSEGYDILWECWRRSPEESKSLILRLLRSLSEGPDAYWVAIAHYVRACMELKLFNEALEACTSPAVARDEISMIWTKANLYDVLERPAEALTILCTPCGEHIYEKEVLGYRAKLARRLKEWSVLQSTLVRLKVITVEHSEGWSMNNCEALAWAHYNCKQYQSCELECLEGQGRCKELLNDNQSKSLADEGQSNKVNEADWNSVVDVQFHLYAILALSRLMQSQEILAFRDCLQATSSDPALWCELSNFFFGCGVHILVSYCLDAGLQEMQSETSDATANSSRLVHNYWQCDSCGIQDFDCAGFIRWDPEQCKSIDMCKICFDSRSSKGSNDESLYWIECPSKEYPRLRIETNNTERIREVIER